MTKILNRLSGSLKSDRSVVFLLGIISIAAFGLVIPFVGFYWDDWIWKYFSHAYSSSYLLWQPIDRPLTGTLHLLLNFIFGDKPILWQIGNLFFRWTNAAAFYWMLRKAFPGRRSMSIILSMFFLVYPGFSEQWISIAFIHHLVPMTVLWLSFVLMFIGIEASIKRDRYLYLGSAMILAVLVMLTTEYFYGIEIFRVVLLFYYFYQREPRSKFIFTVWDTVKVWWLFGAASIAMVVRRSLVGVSEGATYSVNVGQLFGDGIARGIWQIVQKIFAGLYSAVVEVAIKTFTIPNVDAFGSLKTIAYFVLVLGSFGFCWLLLKRLFGKEQLPSRRTALELGLLGIAGLVISGLPIWASNLQYGASFPSDRLGLILVLGWSLFMVGLVFSLTQHKRLGMAILSALFAFGLGANFVSGAAYVQSWEDQQKFWRQFVTRIPALEPGTVVVVSELPVDYMSDLSFMMTLNWLYDLDPSEDGMDYGFFYGDTRYVFTSIEDDMPVVYDQRMVSFESDLDNTLLISYRGGECLYVFNEIDGYDNPNVRHVREQLVAYSNPDLIDIEADGFENWPDFFVPITDDNWCYFFELGELELQRGNYAEVARIGDLAFAGDENPRRSWERAPFIEGYGFVERWGDAVALTAEAMSFTFNAESLMCNIWQRIDSGTPDSLEKQEALEEVAELLSCIEN